ncbi:cell envelope integrity EipB family protein [Rhodopila sp.]|uniref:cell envelope integrity EipB family protein n=1 Tax=Rhodopila sp. TaxID=2480087 RepID=UPI003D098E33
MRFPAALAALLLTANVVAQPAGAASAPVPPPASTGLLAHRALYTLTLGSAKGGDVIAAHGTMGYEVTDACDGWAVRQRLRMTITNADGQDIEMSSDYATWEAKSGLKFRYHVRQMTDEAVTSQTDGEASLQRTGGSGEAHYTSPHDSISTLPAGTLFPMMHTSAIIAAARDRKRFLALPLFDGTDENGVEDSFIVILNWNPPFATKWPVLSGLPSTRVHLSFFDHQPNTMTPSYEVGMRYWENGVADDMQMDFGDFVMNAKMSEFTPQPRHC